MSRAVPLSARRLTVNDQLYRHDDEASRRLRGQGSPPAAPESLGIVLGLTLGKPLGIVGLCWVAVQLGWAKLSAEISWTQLLGAGGLCGVGFTMSIFIATAAFEGGQLEAVKLSILLASVLSATLGMTVLYRAEHPHQTSAER